MPRLGSPLPIPPATRVRTIDVDSWVEGIDTYTPNNEMTDKRLRLAQDARMVELGIYETRKGTDFHSDAAGEADHTSVTSTTGAADQSFNGLNRLAQRFTTSGTGRCTKVTVRLKNDATATGTVMVELWTDSTGPAVMLARSSIAGQDITSGYTYLTARFINAPALANATNYWIVCYVQSTGTNSYKWSSTTSATTARTSANSGTTWAAASFALNFHAYLATDSAPKGFCRAYKSDGTQVTLIAHGTSLYTVNEVTGAQTAIKTGLNSGATCYRFAVVNDTVYYCNELDGLRKWDFTTESQVNSTNYSNLVVHKGMLFANRTSDPNRWDFSNFALYEVFTSTDFIYVPAPKTGDPSTAAMSQNGTLVFQTRFRKYNLYGSDRDTFQLEEASGKKGTYSQESVVADTNFIYFISDDGVYRFNGTTDELLSAKIFETVRTISNKSTCALGLDRGRLYVYYPSPGSAVNDSCIVFNLNFDCVESFDTDTYVAFTAKAFNDDEYLVASSIVGQAFYQDRDSNDYTNLGGDMHFELRTHHQIFGSASVPKQIRKWRPRFTAQSGDYTITCQFATDLRDSATDALTVQTQGSGPRYGTGETYGSGVVRGTSAELQSMTYPPGGFRHLQLRYKHHATRQPQKPLGHTLTVHTRRLR